MGYLLNAWYPAGWADELKAGAMLRRVLLDQPVLLLRDAAGQVHALIDRCPHRFAPLHRGTLLEQGVRCGYHGLEFGFDGRCQHNPHTSASTLPGRIRTFPLIERHSLLWIWMGAPAYADAAAIPDFSFQDPDRFYVGQSYLLARAGYQLEIDNILDLSHIQYLHPTTLGSGDVARGTYAASVDGDTVWSRRATHAETLPEFLYRARNIPSGTPCDRWIDVRWNAPANMALFAGAVRTGEPRRPEDGVAQCHLFTPETRTTTHYWFSIAFPRQMGELGERMAREQIAGLRVPFETEDLPMLEAQQNNIELAGEESLQPLLFKIDAASAHAHRILQSLIASEQTTAANQPQI